MPGDEDPEDLAENGFLQGTASAVIVQFGCIYAGIDCVSPCAVWAAGPDMEARPR